MTTTKIRSRIHNCGWALKEIPIVRTNPETGQKEISRWKLIAHKGEQSVEVGGANIDEAMLNCGQVLGVVGKNVA